jgi:hypothetical protein
LRKLSAVDVPAEGDVAADVVSDELGYLGDVKRADGPR